VIIYDLGHEALNKVPRVDLASVTEEPASPIGHFEFHGCICGIGAFAGRPPWELHSAGDELLHILSGECQLTILGGDDEVTRVLRTGDLVIVPQGRWHSNSAPDGVTMLYMTPEDGNRHSWDDPRIKT
jgi:mannose-6-phosphate isomerase-like protein (cupin superfamily)